MALKNVMRGIGRAAFLPLLVVACSTGLTGMKPANDIPSDAAQTAKTVKNDADALRTVDESYTLQRMTIRYDERTGNYAIQMQGYDNGTNTGTGRATKMYMGFDVPRGMGENRTGNSTVVKVNSIKYDNDPRYNTVAEIDVSLEPNKYGENASVITVTPTEDPSADPEKSGTFEVKSVHFKGKIPLTLTDMGHRDNRTGRMVYNPIANPRFAINEITSSRTLGQAVIFKQNVEDNFNPSLNEYNFLRMVIGKDGQQTTNYFPEDMILTGAQYKYNN